jgi:hypothetical protein
MFENRAHQTYRALRNQTRDPKIEALPLPRMHLELSNLQSIENETKGMKLGDTIIAGRIWKQTQAKSSTSSPVR